MSCKGDWRGRSEAKDVVRERAWAALGVGRCRDDDGPRGRIPDFVGAEKPRRARGTPGGATRVVKSNPDPPPAPPGGGRRARPSTCVRS